MKTEDIQGRNRKKRKGKRKREIKRKSCGKATWRTPGMWGDAYSPVAFDAGSLISNVRRTSVTAPVQREIQPRLSEPTFFY